MKHQQLNLFGEPADPRKGLRGPQRPKGPVGPAAVDADLQRVGERLPANLRLGTSSWSFPGWHGLVYDCAAKSGRLAREGLAAYARHPLLRAVGIDRTFYAPITAEAFAGYAAAVPDDFRFLVKASSLCSSPSLRGERGRSGERNDRFLDAAFATDEVVGPFVEGLGAKAGPLLFQFPPLGTPLQREPERFALMLGSFLGELPRGPQYAVELRDRGLLCDDYFAALEQAGATHCYSVHPRMESVPAQRRAGRADEGGPLVVRWMLNGALEYGQAVERYEPFSHLVDEDPVSRGTLAGMCAGAARKGRDVVVIANNKAEGSAPLTIFELARSIADRLEAADAAPAGLG